MAAVYEVVAANDRGELTAARQCRRSRGWYHSRMELGATLHPRGVATLPFAGVDAKLHDQEFRIILDKTAPFPRHSALCGEHGFNKPGRSRTYSRMKLFERVKTLREHPAVA